MAKNRSRLFDFCLTSGRDLFQDILELETSPAEMFDMLKTSRYYITLSQSKKELYLSLEDQNTFSELELEDILELLKLFTSVKQPICRWCGRCSLETIQSDSIEGCLELVMSLWNILKSSNLMTSEGYQKWLSSLTKIGVFLSKKGAYGESFLENIQRELQENGMFNVAFYIFRFRSPELHLILNL